MPDQGRRTAWGFLLAVVVAIGLPVGLAACGSQQPPGEGDLLGDGGALFEGGYIGFVCTPGTEGCDCTTAGEQAACGKVVDKAGSYVTCSMGYSTCDGKKWGVCVGNQIVAQSLPGTSLKADGIHTASLTGPCANPCDPNSSCMAITPTAGDVPDAQGIIVTEGGVSLTGEGGTGGCTGLGCMVSKCVGTPTTITGTVYDPAGRNALYNATVFVPIDPAGTLPALTEGASCNTCAAAASQSVVATTTTAVDGSFTLSGVPDGANIPIVIQLGKWRRELIFTNVNPCTSNTITNNCTASDQTMCTFHLPRNQYDGYNPADGTYDHGDIPQMAVVEGAWDPLACVLLKAGVDPSEFSSYDGKTPSSGGTVTRPGKRIHYYAVPASENLYYGGAPYLISLLSSAYGNNISGQLLWTSGVDPTPSTPTAPHYDYYDAVMFACTGQYTNWETEYGNPSPNVYQTLVNYANAGGRVYATHHGNTWIDNNLWGANPATWGDITAQNFVPAGQLSGTEGATIIQTFPKGAAFAQWLFDVGASPTLGTLTLTEPREDLSAVGANSTAWMKMASALHAGTFPPHFTFNTPYNNAATSQCGRVLYSDFHVAESALVQNGTPTSNKCLDNLDCGYTETCYGATGGTGTCSEPCRTNADCPDTTYSCNGATPGSCGPPACTHSTSYSCAIGVCTAQSPTALCVCSDDSQCPSNKCINTTGCTGTCSGTGSGDAFGCKPVSTTLPSTCSSSTTHTCTVGTCNTGHTACLCTADSQCASNKCIISAGQNDGVGQCTAGTCTGSGVGDSASCQAVAADPCSANTLYSCTEGTCNAGHSACVCTDNSQCASGKCINTTSCTGTCTGTGVGDGANCVAPTAPPACTPSTTYACAGGLGTCNTADTACLCISDSQCASKKCVISAGQNDGAGQCTAGTCTGSGATDAASCLPVAADPCTSSTMYSCAEGACNAGHTACICTDNSQCASGQCINTTSCTGTCSGTGSGDSASCVPAAGQPACDLGTNYSCTLGVVNQGNSACICINNSQCASGECIILATQNDGPGQCTGATCTGTGSGDSASCVPVASTATCSGTTSYSCSEGTCNAGHTACVCTDNSQCASGKCINTTSCTGTCTGTGAGDSANCAPSSTPPSCTAGTSYSCAGGLGTCDTAHNACYCTANSQCSSGQCIKTAGQNDGAGQCTGATCTGTGAGDSANCMPFNSATCTGTTTHSCTLGACNAGDTGCVCTADTQCQNGLGKCIKTAGVNDGGGQCTAGTCTGLGTPDAIYCATTTEPASPPTGTTVWGGNCPAGTTANSAHTYCVCTADSACPSGACIATLGQNEGAGQCGHGSTCSGAGSGDNMLCATVTEPGTELAATTATCPAGAGNCSNVSSSSGTCSAAGVACWCTTNSQCASGVCRTWAGCSGTCSGASGATTDTFNCVLQAPGIPVAPTSEGGTTYSCTTGGCNTSHDCWCTNNSQCPGSGKCIKVTGQNDGAGECTAGTCTGSGTADNFNCQAVTEPGTCTADSQCDSGKCVSQLLVNGLACALNGPCSGSGSADGNSCQPAPSVVACTATNHYWCSTDLYPLPLPNTADNACLCVKDGQCPSGKCINNATQNQCSGLGPCTGSGTADTAGCQDDSSVATSWSCSGHGNCSSGSCTGTGQACLCTKNSDCSAGSGLCVSSAACSGTCTGTGPADGFNCELASPGIPAAPTAGATVYSCTTGGCNTSHDCWCTNNSQCPGSGKCIKTAGQNDGAGECTAGTCTGSGTADNFNCQAVTQSGSCDKDSQCDSGKCVSQLLVNGLACVLNGPCSGSGSADGNSCQPAPSVVACTATIPYSCTGGVGTPNTAHNACFCTSDAECPSGKCINNATQNQCGGLGPCTGSGTADTASCQDDTAAASDVVLPGLRQLLQRLLCAATGQSCVCAKDSDCSAGAGKCVSSGACTTGPCTGSGAADGFNCQLGNPGIPSSPTVAAGYTFAPGEGVPNTGYTKCLCTSDAECGESGSGKCINDATQNQCTGLGPCTGSGTADPATNCQEVSSSAQPTTYSCAAEGAPTSTTVAGPCLCTANSQCQSNLCANAASQCGGLGPCTGSLAASLDTHDCVVPTYTVPTSVTTYSCSPYGVAVGTTTCICTSDSQCDTGKCIKVTGENDGAGQCGNGSTCSGTGSGDSASCAILTDTCTAHTTYACTGGGACTAPGTTSACTCTTDTQCPSGKCINTTSCTGTCSGTGAGDSFSCMPFTEPSTCNSTATHTCTGGLVCNTADTACLCTADSQCVSGQCLNDATQHQCGGLGPCTAPVGSTVDSTNCLVNGEPPASCTSHTSYACTKGTCTTPGSSTACTCTDNSQCPSNKCINTTSCTGACTGTGAGDPFSCVPFTEPGNPATMTTYSVHRGARVQRDQPVHLRRRLAVPERQVHRPRGRQRRRRAVRPRHHVLRNGSRRRRELRAVHRAAARVHQHRDPFVRPRYLQRRQLGLHLHRQLAVSERQVRVDGAVHGHLQRHGRSGHLRLHAVHGAVGLHVDDDPLVHRRAHVQRGRHGLHLHRRLAVREQQVHRLGGRERRRRRVRPRQHVLRHRRRRQRELRAVRRAARLLHEHDDA